MSLSFVPFFRLLDDHENHLSDRAKQVAPTSSVRFSPHFDLRELKDSYRLDGELPGVNQHDIDIEFTDSSTLSIKGHVERHYEISNDESSPAKTTKSNKTRRFQATVEDEDEEDGTSTETTVATPATSGPPSPAPTSSEDELPAKKAKIDKSTEPEYKYWASERSIGEFSRSFTFASPVDQNAVKATLTNGILTVVVPKANRSGTKKITVE